MKSMRKYDIRDAALGIRSSNVICLLLDTGFSLKALKYAVRYKIAANVFAN